MKVPIHEEKDNGHTPIWMEEQKKQIDQATNDQGIFKVQYRHLWMEPQVQNNV
jgi:hypothetical protein